MRPDFARNGGLVRAIAQDVSTHVVLMDAFMNEEAYEETRTSGHMVYFSRTKQALWHKGEESGNFQIVQEIRINCNRDSLLFMVEQLGDAACHDGYQSCFYRSVHRETQEATVIADRIFDPQQVYKKG